MQQSLKVVATIGGEKRELFYPKAAYRLMAEQMPDVDFEQVRAAVKSGVITPELHKMVMDADRALIVMLWAGLLHADRSLTLEDVEFAILPDEVNDAMESAEQAMALTSERAKRPQSALAKNPTGKRRGRLRN